MPALAGLAIKIFTKELVVGAWGGNIGGGAGDTEEQLHSVMLHTLEPGPRRRRGQRSRLKERECRWETLSFDPSQRFACSSFIHPPNLQAFIDHLLHVKQGS